MNARSLNGIGTKTLNSMLLYLEDWGIQQNPLRPREILPHSQDPYRVSFDEPLPSFCPFAGLLRP